MYLTDRRRIVVDQSHTTLAVFRIQPHFFGDFAKHRLAIGTIKKVAIVRTNMPANADRAQRLQSALRRPLALRVMKNLALIIEHDIRNDLLERRIGLHLRSWPIAENLGI